MQSTVSVVCIPGLSASMVGPLVVLGFFTISLSNAVPAGCRVNNLNRNPLAEGKGAGQLFLLPSVGRITGSSSPHRSHISMPAFGSGTNGFICISSRKTALPCLLWPVETTLEVIKCPNVLIAALPTTVKAEVCSGEKIGMFKCKKNYCSS